MQYWAVSGQEILFDILLNWGWLIIIIIWALHPHMDIFFLCICIMHP